MNEKENEVKLSLEQKLCNIQSTLKAPKGQENKFGKFKYRSCEDILKAMKPMFKKYGVFIILSDEPIVREGRFYVLSTASIVDAVSKERITVQAFAREPLDKKGMDESQITGATSSYARKYALNGLLAIDDTKDTDNYNHGQQKNDQPVQQKTFNPGY